MRILGLVGDYAAQGMYRIILPLIGLKEQGLAEVHFSNQVKQEEVFWADLVILQRQHSKSILELVPKMKRQSKILVYELDDNLHAVRPTSTAYVTYNKSTGVLPLVCEFIEGCHGMTVTRGDLRKAYLPYNKNIEVLPNFMDLRLWQTPKVNNGKDIVIGWAGSATHYEDIQICADAIAHVVNKYDNVKFAIAGFFPRNLFTGIQDKDKIILVNPRPFKIYSEVLSHFDIGIAPLHDNLFNIAKSNIKYLEYSLTGIPTIASNVGPYKDTITNGVNGVIVNKPRFNDWKNALERIIENESERRRIGKVAKEYVTDVWALHKNVWRWRDAYEKIKEGVK